MELRDAIIATLKYVKEKCKWRSTLKNTTSILRGLSTDEKTFEAPTYKMFPSTKKYIVQKELDKLCEEGIVKKYVDNNKTYYTLTENTNAIQKVKPALKTVVPPKEPILPLSIRKFLNRMSNKEGAKTFTNDDFWKTDYDNNNAPPEVTNDILVTAFKESFWVGSDYEKKFLLDIEKSGKALDAGMNLVIKYDTHFAANKSYWVDFIIYTAEKHIALVEIKNIEAISHHIVVSKYEAMKKYAEEHGYEYMLYDPVEDVTFEELIKEEVNTKLYHCFEEWYYDESTTMFDDEDVKEWMKECADQSLDVKTMKRQIHGMVLFHRLYNTKMLGLRVYKTPDNATKEW